MGPLKCVSAMLLLAQLSGCAGIVCPPDAEEPYAARKLPVSTREVDDVVVQPDGDVIVVERRFPAATVVTQVDAAGEEVVAQLPNLGPTDVAPSLIMTDDDWWFSRMGFDGVKAKVFFVSGGAAARKTERPIDGYGATLVWLPIRGPEPRGLLLSAVRTQPALSVVEVTPSGSRRLGAFEWWQTSSQLISRHDSRWSAELLGDGRYVIAALDGPPGETALHVRTISSEAVSVAVLPCEMADQSIDTAVDPSGTLAVVGLSEKGEVVVALARVDDSEAAHCRVLSAPGEVAASPGLGTPSVVWSGDRFITAWIRDDGVVRARELNELQRHQIIADVGSDADLLRPLRQLVQGSADAVTFTWRDRRGDLVTRRLPNELTAYVLGTELRRLVCATLARSGPM